MFILTWFAATLRQSRDRISSRRLGTTRYNFTFRAIGLGSERQRCGEGVLIGQWVSISQPLKATVSCCFCRGEATRSDPNSYAVSPRRCAATRCSAGVQCALAWRPQSWSPKIAATTSLDTRPACTQGETIAAAMGLSPMHQSVGSGRRSEASRAARFDARRLDAVTYSVRDSRTADRARRFALPCLSRPVKACKKDYEQTEI